jgi:hypothetical protein
VVVGVRRKGADGSRYERATGRAGLSATDRGTEDLELAYEILQPDRSSDVLSVKLRRSIVPVRLGGDGRNDRDLRLVQGSALDRLLSDRGLRSGLASSSRRAT